MSAYAELNNARDEWEEYEAREAIKHEANEENRAEREELMERVEAVRMTPKEAINILKFLKQYVTTNEIKPIEMSIDALEKADKYRWHDLRKDPTDLPTKRDWVLAVFKEPDCDFVLVPRVADYVGYETSATTEEFWLIVDVHTEDMSDYYKSLKCIAWKEIEPFEVKE